MIKKLKTLSYFIILLFIINSIIILYRYFNNIKLTTGPLTLITLMFGYLTSILIYFCFKIISDKTDDRSFKISSKALIIITTLLLVISFLAIAFSLSILGMLAMYVSWFLSITMYIFLIILAISVIKLKEKMGNLAVIAGVLIILFLLIGWILKIIFASIYPDQNTDNLLSLIGLFISPIYYVVLILFFFKASRVLKNN